MQEYVNLIDLHWSTITEYLFNFGYHIHGGKFDAGLYLVEYPLVDDNQTNKSLVISINQVNDDIFWGIPIVHFGLDENMPISINLGNNITIGISTYEKSWIVRKIREPKRYILDIDYKCKLHSKHKYIICDNCNDLFRTIKIMYSSESKDLCDSCYNIYKGIGKKYKCNCSLVIS